MGADNEFAVFLDETQKQAILRGIFDGYYGALSPAREVVFDTNRAWASRLPALRTLFPGAKAICCVRNPAWVFDSIERLLRRNALDESKLFSPAERADIYSRAEALACAKASTARTRARCCSSTTTSSPRGQPRRWR